MENLFTIYSFSSKLSGISCHNVISLHNSERCVFPRFHSEQQLRWSCSKYKGSLFDKCRTTSVETRSAELKPRIMIIKNITCAVKIPNTTWAPGFNQLRLILQNIEQFVNCFRVCRGPLGCNYFHRFVSVLTEKQCPIDGIDSQGSWETLLWWHIPSSKKHAV